MAELTMHSNCPLDDVWSPGKFGQQGEAGVTLERTTPLSIVQLSLFPDSAQKALTKLKKLGAQTFPENGMSAIEKDISILSLGADRYLLESDQSDLYKTLKKAIPVNLGSVTDLSSARIVLTLTGPAAESVLQKSIAVDFQLMEFPVGKVIQTLAHHMSVTVERKTTYQFRILVFSTYAHSALDWLMSASHECGCEVKLTLS